MKFKQELKKELNGTRLRIRMPGVYAEDYQLRMLRENRIGGLLPISARGEGAETVYEYDITGLVSLRAYYKEKKITREEMKNFLIKLQETADETENYLLNPNRLLLEPEYIFWRDGKYSFCYFPQGEEEIRSAFHRLMDEFVQWTDYQDIPSVKTAFLLHRETMKENYSLKGVLQKLEEQEKMEVPQQVKAPQAAEKKISEGKSGMNEISNKEIRQAQQKAADPVVPREITLGQDTLWSESDYDTSEHDWITRQEMGSKIMKETDNLWNPVKRLLHRHRRPKWGEWDGVYVDEEEL